MKRFLAIIAVTAAIVTAAVAQPAPGRPRPASGPGGPGGQGAPGPRPEVLADYLQLTASQKVVWESSREKFRALADGLEEQQGALHKQLDTLLQNKSTDACAIGSLMLQTRAIGDQIRSAHDATDAKFEAVLTAEQKAKFEAFRAAIQAIRP